MLPKKYRYTPRPAMWKIACRMVVGAALLAAGILCLRYGQIKNAVQPNDKTLLLAAIVILPMGIEQMAKAMRDMLRPRTDAVLATSECGGKYYWAHNPMMDWLGFHGFALLVVVKLPAASSASEAFLLLLATGVAVLYRFSLRYSNLLYFDYSLGQVFVCRFKRFWWEKCESRSLQDFCAVTYGENKVVLLGKPGKEDLPCNYFMPKYTESAREAAGVKLHKLSGLPLVERQE